MNNASILERRQHLLGPSLSVAYREPLKIVRGQGLFIGVELVNDHDSLTPAADVANQVILLLA